ncbi:hypothetical protein ERJ75_001784600 [Trypanosoma vivax]|nr:hypothetical protein ERJ75_001784600 [Trypanosoma vivax]
MDSSPRSGRTPSRNTALRHGSEATNNAEWQQHPRRKDGALTTRRPHRHYRAFRCQETSHARRQPLHRGDCQAAAVSCHALARWDGNASPLPPPPSRLASDERVAATDRQRPPRSRCGDAPSPKPLPNDSAGGQREATATVSTQVSRPTCSARPSGPGAAFGRRGKRALAPSANTGRTMQIKCLDAVGAKQQLRFPLQSLRSGSTSPHAKKQPGRHAAQAPAAQTPAQARRRRAPAPMTGLQDAVRKNTATGRNAPKQPLHFTEGKRANAAQSHEIIRVGRHSCNTKVSRCRRAKLAIKKLRPRTSGRTGPCFPKSTSPAEKTLTHSLGNKTKNTRIHEAKRGNTETRTRCVSTSVRGPRCQKTCSESKSLSPCTAGVAKRKEPGKPAIVAAHVRGSAQHEGNSGRKGDSIRVGRKSDVHFVKGACFSASASFSRRVKNATTGKDD